jgi:hypothetical protein
MINQLTNCKVSKILATMDASIQAYKRLYVVCSDLVSYYSYYYWCKCMCTTYNNMCVYGYVVILNTYYSICGLWPMYCYSCCAGAWRLVVSTCRNLLSPNEHSWANMYVNTNNPNALSNGIRNAIRKHIVIQYLPQYIRFPD